VAWLGELKRDQIQRLWFVDRSESAVQKTLGELRSDKLIAARAWSVRDTERNVTVPHLARWSLTSAGHQQLRACGDYPDRPMRPRQMRLLEDDARTVETIVRLIELVRPYGLSGSFVRHEAQLDARHPHRICDALVIIYLGDIDPPNQVPWSRGSRLDMGRTYARLSADLDWLDRWRERYGTPLPVWVAPTPRGHNRSMLAGVRSGRRGSG
jgi:hypothetical protein